jgi:hypothetical protein
VDNDPGTDAQEAESVPADRCPRCGVELAAAAACTRCGLAREFFGRFVESTALSGELKTAWDHVLAGWDEPSRHALFLEQCAQAEALDLAAARYRPLAEDPARGERARAALERIVALAERELQRTAAPRDNLKRNKRILFAIGLLITLGFLGFVAWAVLAR